MRFNIILIHNRKLADRVRCVKILLVLLAGIISFSVFRNTRVTGVVAAAQEDKPSTAGPRAIFERNCFVCHGLESPQAGLSLERLTAQGLTGDNFQRWQKVAAALEQKMMPPKGMPQPSDDERRQALSWIKARMNAYAEKHDGDPGPITIRRLTSGEYAYTIKDLTGLDLNVGIDASSDSVGGEGFTNFGNVQFMQDANLERYLEAAKTIADHAVIGSGPLEFFLDRGKTGFELSAIARIREIYAANGFRTVSGEGGMPFGLEKYGKALYDSWLYQHRASLGEAREE
jgi:mono/diheme cytochrome c family protein